MKKWFKPIEKLATLILARTEEESLKNSILREEILRTCAQESQPSHTLVSSNVGYPASALLSHSRNLNGQSQGSAALSVAGDQYLRV